MSILAASLLNCSSSITDREVKQKIGSAPRRTDRLTLLSLLAAKPLKHLLHSSCGLYVASVNPDEKNMQELLNAVCIQKLAPKPFQFVNSVSNAAGFYLAKELQLEGPNLFIGSNDNVWNNLLMLAKLDLACTVKQALLINCINLAAPRIEVILLDAPLIVSGLTDFDRLCQQTPNFSSSSL